MNFNPMDLIKVKEHFKGCFDEKEISTFINILIEMQNEYREIDAPLKESLGSDFFKKQEMIQAAYTLTGMRFNFQERDF
jgi:hypothetical protein